MGSTLYNKDQILFKTSNLNGTAVRVWNNLVFNPNNVTNQENNVNPLLPKFFHNPSLRQVQDDQPDENKMDHYLKKEIEEYRSGDKKINYNSKKDVMIKMLIDELER